MLQNAESEYVHIILSGHVQNAVRLDISVGKGIGKFNRMDLIHLCSTFQIFRRELCQSDVSDIPENYVLKSVTVSMEPSGKYYAALLYEYPVSENQAGGKNMAARERAGTAGTPDVLGIDFAMQGMAVFSDGSRAGYPMYYRKAQERISREQRKLSRCRKGSRNYGKQKRILAKCYEKVRNQRKDYLHKLSRKIADVHDAAAVEDIDMKGMSRCLKFGKSVMDDSYGAFRNMLSYKLKDQGKELVVVGRLFPSSRMCSRCGHVKKELRLDERIYRCGCGNCMDRDVNAAVNIREEGCRILMSA